MGAVAMALVLSGCVIVKDLAFNRASGIAKVSVTTTICGAKTTGCPGNGNSMTVPVNTGQILLAYFVPEGTVAPASLRFDDDAGGGPVFTREPSYEAEMNRLLPNTDGFVIVGYRSTPITYTAGTTPTSGTVTAEFGVPPLASGDPFPNGAYVVSVAVGSRIVDATNLGSRPVLCGPNPIEINAADGTICINSGKSAVAPTTDFAVRPVVPVTATRGQIASVPFTGALSSALVNVPTFSTSASTTLPGATVTTSPASFTPAGPATTLVASVSVPANAPAGSFPVTFTASLPNGQSRTGVSTIVVPPAAGGAAGGGGGGGAGTAIAAPALSRLTVSPKAISSKRGRPRPPSASPFRSRAPSPPCWSASPPAAARAGAAWRRPPPCAAPAPRPAPAT